MMLLRTLLIVIAGSGGVLSEGFGHYEGPIQANCVVDDNSF